MTCIGFTETLRSRDSVRRKDGRAWSRRGRVKQPQGDGNLVSVTVKMSVIHLSGPSPLWLPEWDIEGRWLDFDKVCVFGHETLPFLKHNVLSPTLGKEDKAQKSTAKTLKVLKINILQWTRIMCFRGGIIMNQNKIKDRSGQSSYL